MLAGRHFINIFSFAIIFSISEENCHIWSSSWTVGVALLSLLYMMGGMELDSNIPSLENHSQ